MGPTTRSEKLDWFTRVTGAYPLERRRVLACFWSLFCLLTSYYLLKPLRNSQFLKEFPPEALPLFYLLVSALSFTATKAFSYLYERLDNSRLLTATFAIICMCKLFFMGGLLIGGKAISGLFFLWGSTYFLLALAAVWGCINELFRAEQGERCFGFIASGATLGCIAGSELASHLALRGSLALLISAVFMLASLFFILMARRAPRLSRRRHRGRQEVQTAWLRPKRDQKPAGLPLPTRHRGHGLVPGDLQYGHRFYQPGADGPTPGQGGSTHGPFPIWTSSSSIRRRALSSSTICASSSMPTTPTT